MKKLIAFILAWICAFSFIGCSNDEVKVWDWVQSLDQENIVSVTPWSQDRINQDYAFKSLNDKEILELITLLNKLTQDSFTHNKHLRGGTPTFGVEIVIDSETYHMSEYNGPNGTLEIKYNEKQWIIDNTALFSFIQRITDSVTTE